MELRTQSDKLYSAFALKEKDEARKKGGRFRTLRHLAEGKSFSGADAAILSQILEVSQKQLNLIETEGWAVDESGLSELLGHLGTHIRVMHLAAQGKLVTENETIKELVNPLEVNGALESEIRRLQDQYDVLLNGKATKPNMPNLDISEVKTVDWYDQNSEEYYRRSTPVNMEEQYLRFLEFVPPGGLILDAGCGVGRDTRFFIKRGYRVVSFDASRRMVDICRRYPFSYCNHMSFNQLEYVEAFDGIWANASLLHVSEAELSGIFWRFCNAIKTDGVLYISLKTSQGSKSNNGRVTHLYDEEDIINMAKQELSLSLERSWSNTSSLEEDDSEFMNLIFRKKDFIKKV